MVHGFVLYILNSLKNGWISMLWGASKSRCIRTMQRKIHKLSAHNFKAFEYVNEPWDHIAWLLSATPYKSTSQVDEVSCLFEPF